jgi:hypothetical protein
VRLSRIIVIRTTFISMAASIMTLQNEIQQNDMAESGGRENERGIERERERES